VLDDNLASCHAQSALAKRHRRNHREKLWRQADCQSHRKE
jgi:hypothetical protein